MSERERERERERQKYFVEVGIVLWGRFPLHGQPKTATFIMPRPE